LIKHFGREFILPPDAAELAGLKNGAIYKAIRKRKLPAIVEVVRGKRNVKIPSQPFLEWLDKEIERFEKKVRFLQKSRNQLREYIYGSR
jgi:hypothetical protein